MQPLNLTEYIKVYDDILAQEECDYLIQKFEASKENWDANSQEGLAQLNISLPEDWREESNFFETLIFSGSNLYFQDMSLELLPDLQGFEEIKIWKYENTYSDSDSQIDVYDYRTAKRFLSCFFFLNDSDDESIVFPTLDIKIPAKRGSALFFPPFWMFAYQTKKPSKDTRYVLGSYLHYM